MKTTYKVTGQAMSTYYKLIHKQLIPSINHKKIEYSYRTVCGQTWGNISTLYLTIKDYSLEEIQLIDELFSNLDANNLVMIKAIIHSKYKKDEEL